MSSGSRRNLSTKQVLARTLILVLVAGLCTAVFSSQPVQAATSTQNFSLFQQFVGNYVLYTPLSLGSKSISLSVSPTSSGVGAPIEVSVTSSNLAIDNQTPSSRAADTDELDAVIHIDGVDYVLRGSRTGQDIGSGYGYGPNTLYKEGWVISSSAGWSSSTSGNYGSGEVAGSGGLGASVRGSEESPITLTAPGFSGTYVIGLKAIVINRDTSTTGGTSGPGVGDGFDEVINTTSTTTPLVYGNEPGLCGPGGPVGCGSFQSNTSQYDGTNASRGDFVFSNPVALNVFGPTASVDFIGRADPANKKYVRSPTVPPGVSGGSCETSIGKRWNPRCPETAVESDVMSISGTNWDTSYTSSDFSVAMCSSSCVALATNDFSLTSDGSGNISGRVQAGKCVCNEGQFSPGQYQIVLTRGPETARFPVEVLANPTVVLTPVSGGVNTPVSISAVGLNPYSPLVISPVVSTRGETSGAINGTAASPTCTSTFDTPSLSTGGGPCVLQGSYRRGPTNQFASPLPRATASGTYQGFVQIDDPDTTGIQILEKQFTCDETSFVCAPFNTDVDLTYTRFPSNPRTRAYAEFSVVRDQCVSWYDNEYPDSCATTQNINISVVQGQLTQRTYVNASPSTGSIANTDSAPVVGTSNFNPDPTTINLGSITSPLAPAAIVGTLNDITVSDNRGGSYGWTLSAELEDFVGNPSGSISKGQLTVTAACQAATSLDAWDYASSTKTAISGFDGSLNAPGAFAYGAQDFSSVVNLCTKDTQENSISQTTGGVYNVSGALTLTVPAFQAAARYVATMTVTLS